jgi:PadR family transcriptional regulator, regulatory protein AphA
MRRSVTNLTLTPTSYIVLGLLDLLGEASPYDLKQRVAESIGNFWSVPHSQLYREPDRLRQAGLVSERRERTPGGRPKKLYRLTAKGRSELKRWREEPPDQLPELRDPGLLKLFFGSATRPLAETRLAAHRRKLSEYRERRKFDPGTGPRGPWEALDAGIAHERVWVRFWSGLLDG